MRKSETQCHNEVAKKHGYKDYADAQSKADTDLFARINFEAEEMYRHQPMSEVDRIIEWSNKRLALKCKELDDDQIEVLSFAIKASFGDTMSEKFPETVEEVKEYEKTGVLPKQELSELSERRIDDIISEGFLPESAGNPAKRIHEIFSKIIAEKNEELRTREMVIEMRDGEIFALKDSVEWLENAVVELGYVTDKKPIQKELQSFIDEIKKRKPSQQILEFPSDELWDEISERVGEDIDSLQYFAGRDVITKERYHKLVAEINSQIIQSNKDAMEIIKELRNEIDILKYSNNKESSINGILWVLKESFVKGVLGQYTKEEISFGKMVELFNEKIQSPSQIIQDVIGVKFAEWIAKKKYIITNPHYSSNGDYMWFITKESIGRTTTELYEQFKKEL